MKIRPITTLFMLTSIDGKITCGASDDLDFDKDLPKIKGVAEGLHQYYQIEQTTDLYSLITGKVLAKLGFNNRKDIPSKTEVFFVIIDRKPHFNKRGLEYLCKRSKQVILVTDNSKHEAFNLKLSNLKIMFMKQIDLSEAFSLMYDLGVENLTVQSGGLAAS